MKSKLTKKHIPDLFFEYSFIFDRSIAEISGKAIQREVYKLLNRDDFLSELKKWYDFLGGVYPRAWEITNDVEYRKTLIKEVRSNDIKNV